ncbi:HNH endonuclease family protein [Chloroflexota bacterium]
MLYYESTGSVCIFETLSVEHILPQTPKEDSRWVQDFTSEQREELTDKLGNLVSISSRKNTAQGRLDFAEKAKKYFEKNIDTCPNSLRVLHRYQQWTPAELLENQGTVLAEIQKRYGIEKQGADAVR